MHGIRKIWTNIYRWCRFIHKGFCVSRGVLPLKEKGWWKFLSLSVLSEYFVYRKVIYTFTNYNFTSNFSWQMLLHVEYLFAFVLSLSAKTTKGREYGVFFHIKENHFFNFDSESLFRSEKTDFLLSCSVSCANQGSCRSANFLENPGFPTFAAARWRQIQQLIGFYSQMVLSI